MGFDLRGKTALLTGASSEIGWALAKAMAQSGATIAVSGRDEDALAQLALQIRADGGDARVLAADLAYPGSAAELAARANAELGRVDVLVNGARVNVEEPLSLVGDSDAARAAFEAGYWSALALTAALVPAMRARADGAVVNLARIVPMGPAGGVCACRSAAIAAATRALYAELDGTGVRSLLVMVPKLGEQAHEIAPEIASFVVRGLEKGAHEIAYAPRFWATRLLPSLARWARAE